MKFFLGLVLIITFSNVIGSFEAENKYTFIIVRQDKFLNINEKNEDSVIYPNDFISDLKISSDKKFWLAKSLLVWDSYLKSKPSIINFPSNMRLQTESSHPKLDELRKKYQIKKFENDR